MLSSAAFAGVLAESWIRCGAFRTQVSVHSWHHGYLPCHTTALTLIKIGDFASIAHILLNFGYYFNTKGREPGKYLPFIGSLPKCQYQSVLGPSRSWELHHSLSCGWHGPRSLSCPLLSGRAHGQHAGIGVGHSQVESRPPSSSCVSITMLHARSHTGFF